MKQSPSPDRLGKAQKLRIRRLYMALAAYGVVLAAVYISIFIGLGSMSLEVFGLFIIISMVGNAFFHYLFKTDKNLAFNDPSLTLLQMLFSVC